MYKAIGVALKQHVKPKMVAIDKKPAKQPKSQCIILTNIPNYTNIQVKNIDYSLSLPDLIKDKDFTKLMISNFLFYLFFQGRFRENF